MEPKQITSLANLLRDNGDKILTSEFKLTLSGSLLRALNDSFTLIADQSELYAPLQFQVVKPNTSKSDVFRDLQLIHDFVQKTIQLCIKYMSCNGNISINGGDVDDDYFEGLIDITKFRNLRILEIQKVNIKQIIGIQPLRAQLNKLICQRCLTSIDDIITYCGGDNSNGFVWNELKSADFSYNNLMKVDKSLEFVQYLQILDLSHNKLISCEAIKWLPNLKILNLSYNRLNTIPSFHLEASRRLQILLINNNYIENLNGVQRLDALTELDLSDNFLLEHTKLLPLNTLVTLKYLNLYGNPLYCHPEHRINTACYLNKNAESVKFVLDTKTLTKHEKTFIGKYLMYQQHSIQTSATRSILSPLKYERSSITNEQMINTTNTSTTASQNQMTASSSVGSTKSYGGLNESMTTITVTETTEPANINSDMTTSLSSIKNDKSSTKKLRRRRTVDLEQQQQHSTTNNFSSTSSVISPNSQSKLSSLSTAALNTTSSATVSDLDSSKFMKKSKINDKLLMTTSTDHLETKKQIEDLRKRFGDSWLHGDNSHMIKSVIGLNDNDNDKYFKLTSKQLIDDFLGESMITNQQDLSKNLKKNDKENDKELPSSSLLLPSSNKNKDYHDDHIQNKDKIDELNTTDNSLYKSVTSTDDNNTTSNSSILYNSAIEDGQSILNDIYSSVNDEPEISEPEDNENTYIVYGTDKNDELLLTVSDISIKERDVLTRRTKTKWSLKILQSCDRIKASTLRINFDTIRKDKRERVYTVEEGLCQELENYLRDILSKRLLSEMNQTVYRCVNCACQFSRENTYNKNPDIFCPECKSAYVVEVHEPTSKSSGISVSLEQQKDLKFHSTPVIITTTAMTTITSTATTVVAKTPPKNNTSSSNTTTISDALKAVQTSSSISTTIAAAAAEVATNLHKQQHGINENSGSAGSLNESSSCSKISNSQSSFDSNQSVAGSSTNERDLDLLNYFKNKNNCESDVEILSNPSQSSIEVLDSGIGGLITNYANNNNNGGGGGGGAGNGNRKISEERKFLQIPSLETIEDRNVNTSDGDGGSNYDGDVDDDDNDNGIKIWDYNLQKLMIKNTDKNEKDNSIISEVKTDDKNETSAVEDLKKTTEASAAKTSSINDLSGGKKNLLSNVNLTESSSSGSITDSICTAYEQQQNDKVSDTVSTSTLTGSNSGGGGVVETITSDGNNSGSNKTIIIDKDNNKKDESIITSMLGGLFQTTNLLMSSSKSQKSLSSNTNLDSNIKKSSSSSSLLQSKTSSSSVTKTILEKFKFNYEDFGDVDHRLKLYFYQTKFDDANEHFKWLVKGKILNELNMELINGIIVMSTTKLYIMEIIEINNQHNNNNQKYNNYDNDNITKWLKQIVNIKLERLEQIQLLPWHIGLSFKIRNYGTFLLILQDILRTDSLLLYFANNPLPSNCILEYQISDKLMKKLSICVDSEQLKMFSLLNKCEIIKNFDNNNKNNDNVNIMKNDKIILPSCCCLLITDTHLYITKSNLSWLSLNLNTKIDIYMKQLMSNLIEIKRNNINSKNIFINFLDETNQKNDTKWNCEFETIENTDSCLNAIGQSWEKLFGVPLIFSSNNDDGNVCDQKNTT